MRSSRSSIITFFVLLLAASSYCYFPILTRHSLEGGDGARWLMWCPGFAGIITCLIFQRNLKGFGWLPGNFKWLLLGYFIPIIYSLAAYSTIWISGLGGFPNQSFVNEIQRDFPAADIAVSIARFLLDTMVISFMPGLVNALGEEIGWRGFLVPKLSKTMSYTKVSVIVGTIWALWHFPAILCTDYNIGTPAWCALPCFTILVIEVSFILAWLRLRSKSVWPCVLLHSSHNAIIQLFLTPITINKTYTKFFIDEFGIGLVITAGVIAWVCWKNQASANSGSSALDSIANKTSS